LARNPGRADANCEHCRGAAFRLSPDTCQGLDPDAREQSQSDRDALAQLTPRRLQHFSCRFDQSHPDGSRSRPVLRMAKATAPTTGGTVSLTKFAWGAKLNMVALSGSMKSRTIEEAASQDDVERSPELPDGVLRTGALTELMPSPIYHLIGDFVATMAAWKTLGAMQPPAGSGPNRRLDQVFQILCAGQVDEDLVSAVSGPRRVTGGKRRGRPFQPSRRRLQTLRALTLAGGAGLAAALITTPAIAASARDQTRPQPSEAPASSAMMESLTTSGMHGSPSGEIAARCFCSWLGQSNPPIPKPAPEIWDRPSRPW